MLGYYLVLLGSCLSSITNFVTNPSNVWAPIVLLGVLMVSLVLGIIYVLSPFIGRSDIRTWVRTKLYDQFFTVVLLLIFLAFSTTLCSFQPAAAYHTMGLISKECDPTINNALPQQLDNLYGIADCDLYQFNQNIGYFVVNMYRVMLIVSLSPQFTFGQGYNGVGYQFVVPLLPIEPIHHYLIPFMSLFFGLVLISQMQQFLVGASMLFFPLFMSIGLMARAFGITRSFGGSMIALALGLGFVYPVMISVTYGFLDFTTQQFGLGTGTRNAELYTLFSPSQTIAFIETLFNPSSTPKDLLAVVLSDFTPIILYSGIVAAGIGFVPLMVLTIVDAFVVDTSRVIGERIDVISLLTRII
ncbi:MAG: hypothetical protein KGH74_02000 [Candidatus Micrarchaeota archaeon]|nr:hypothetical protein [Candidatus Micrarchaeota archaeon]MDE1824051.1 hypothetical protein [Candidatus Micrarchaeota archaeon]